MSDIAALLTWTNIRFLLEGLGLTLIISALAIACSIVLGAVISIMRGTHTGQTVLLQMLVHLHL